MKEKRNEVIPLLHVVVVEQPVEFCPSYQNSMEPMTSPAGNKCCQAQM
jgi:hypothetical protein